MKRNLLLFVIVGLVLFLGCSEQTDMQSTPETNPMLSTMDVRSAAVDCENWTWEELNSYGIAIADEMNSCAEFNKMLIIDYCFFGWFDKLIEKGLENGEMEIVDEESFCADEHTTGPHCGVVDAGNANCFNGDYEKLSLWVHKIIDRGNEKEILNKLNHNPCMRLWLRLISHPQLIVPDPDKEVSRLIRRIITPSICPSYCPEGCTILTTIIDYKDGTQDRENITVCK